MGKNCCLLAIQTISGYSWRIFLLRNNRKSVDAIKLHVGQSSLIVPDEGEQVLTASSIIIFEGYNNQSKLHDIALVEVWNTFESKDKK